MASVRAARPARVAGRRSLRVNAGKIEHVKNGGVWKPAPKDGPEFSNTLSGIFGKNGNHATLASFVAVVRTAAAHPAREQPTPPTRDCVCRLQRSPLTWPAPPYPRSQTIEDEMSSPGPFTFFAPEDDAWGPAAKKMGTTKISLMSDPGLKDVLLKHVVEGQYAEADLTDGLELTSLAGTPIKIEGGKVNGSKVKKANFKASNGVYHTIADALI